MLIQELNQEPAVWYEYTGIENGDGVRDRKMLVWGYG